MALKEYHPEQQLLLWAPPQDVLPPDHLCFIVDEIVEQLDLTALPDRRKTPGHPAYDARVLVKILFYGYATGTFSSRKLMKACQEGLPYTFLTREQFPDFRTISDFRKDNRKVIEDLFVQIVRLAYDMGVANLGTVALDSTKIRANASRRATFRTEEFEREIAQFLQQGVGVDEDEDNRFGKEKTGEEQPEQLRTSKQRLQRLKQVLKRVAEQERNFVNVTDPESGFQAKGKALIPSYNAQAVVDKNGVVVDACVRSNPADYDGLPQAVENIQNNLSATPSRLLSDSGFHSKKNLKLLEEEQIEGYIPSQQQARDSKDKYQPSKFSKDKFSYDAENKCYVCPAGEKLTLWRTSNSARQYLFRGGSCPQCRYLTQCVRGQTPHRIISRSFDEQIMDRMRQRMESEQGKEIYSQRKWMIEPLFGHFKHNLKFRQFLTRGKRSVETEWLLLCIANNIRKVGHLLLKPPLRPAVAQANVGEIPLVRANDCLTQALSSALTSLRTAFMGKTGSFRHKFTFCVH